MVASTGPSGPQTSHVTPLQPNRPTPDGVLTALRPVAQSAPLQIMRSALLPVAQLSVRSRIQLPQLSPSQQAFADALELRRYGSAHDEVNSELFSPADKVKPDTHPISRVHVADGDYVPYDEGGLKQPSAKQQPDSRPPSEVSDTGGSPYFAEGHAEAKPRHKEPEAEAHHTLTEYDLKLRELQKLNEQSRVENIFLREQLRVLEATLRQQTLSPPLPQVQQIAPEPYHLAALSTLRMNESYLKPLTESETRMSRFDLSQKSVRLTLPGLLAFLAVRNPTAHSIVTMPDSEWETRKQETNLAEHNKWLALALKQLFARPSPNTDAFERLVVNTVSPAQQIDGRWLFLRMQQPIIPLTGKQERSKYDDFKDATYLVAGTDIVTTFATLGVLISDFQALPPLYASQENGLLHALLHHFGKVCPEKAEALADELAVHEAGGIPFAHSQQQLVKP